MTPKRFYRWTENVMMFRVRGHLLCIGWNIRNPGRFGWRTDKPHSVSRLTRGRFLVLFPKWYGPCHCCTQWWMEGEPCDCAFGLCPGACLANS